MKTWLDQNRSQLTFLLVGVVLGGLVGWLIAWYYTDRKLPLYAVSNSYLYVDSGKDQDLTILWKGQKIGRAYLTFVALWNNGNQLIDAADIPSSGPIVLEPDQPVHILYARAANEWPGLGLTANLNDDIAGGKRVHVNWKSDEALEPNRGGVIRIIYEATSPISFHVKGRVKGAPEGFVKSSSKPDTVG